MFLKYRKIFSPMLIAYIGRDEVFQRVFLMVGFIFTWFD